MHISPSVRLSIQTVHESPLAQRDNVSRPIPRSVAKIKVGTLGHISGKHLSLSGEIFCCLCIIQYFTLLLNEMVWRVDLI